MNEAQLQESAETFARFLGVMVHHQLTYCPRCHRPLPAAGDAGFPDLVLAGPYGVMFRELKASAGLLRPRQTRWRHQLIAGGADYQVWRPLDWINGRIEDQIRALTVAA